MQVVALASATWVGRDTVLWDSIGVVVQVLGGCVSGMLELSSDRNRDRVCEAGALEGSRGAGFNKVRAGNRGESLAIVGREAATALRISCFLVQACRVEHCISCSCGRFSGLGIRFPSSCGFQISR